MFDWKFVKGNTQIKNISRAVSISQLWRIFTKNNMLGKVSWAMSKNLSVHACALHLLPKPSLSAERGKRYPESVLNGQLGLSVCINDPYGSCYMNLITWHGNRGNLLWKEWKAKTFSLIGGPFILPSNFLIVRGEGNERFFFRVFLNLKEETRHFQMSDSLNIIYCEEDTD